MRLSNISLYLQYCHVGKLVIGDDFVLTGFKEKEWIEAMHV